VVAKSIDSIQPQAMRKAIEIVGPQTKPAQIVNGDEGTLVETLTNILGNAVKYSRPSSQVVISAETVEHEVVIAIADSGIGIAPEDLPHIFGDFYTGKADQSTEHGSGIGLAVARRIVEAHNGSITVESQPGKGSTFAIHLPLLEEREPA
jgi:signal transduction histidine kinase